MANSNVKVVVVKVSGEPLLCFTTMETHARGECRVTTVQGYFRKRVDYLSDFIGVAESGGREDMYCGTKIAAKRPPCHPERSSG